MDDTTVSFQASIDPESLSRALKQVSSKNLKLHFDIDSSGMERFATDVQRIAGSEHSGSFYQSGTGNGKCNGAKAEKTEASVYGNLCASITCA